MKEAFRIIKSRHITEKSTVLGQLHGLESNRCLARCKTPKYVFIVDRKANKCEIAKAVESLYEAQKIKVIKVNTINVKGKPKRKGKGRWGTTSQFKKAIVTMEPGDDIDMV
ncbi:MAG: 50S ribosomal protein L23 [Chlamydiales bacterium]